MDKKCGIKNLPFGDRPYERFKKIGADKLSDAELLAIIIRNGSKKYSAMDIADMIIKDGGISNLVNYSYESLKDFDGIGEIKAIQLKCICELTSRLENSKRKNNLNFSSAEEVANYARGSMRFKNYEILKIYYLSSKLKLLYEDEYTSNDDKVIVPIKKIVRKALMINSSRIIVVHNHPSNNILPSDDDLITTNKLKNALNSIDISLDDHIIISDNDYYSMRFNEDM